MFVVVCRIKALKDIYILIPGICEYVTSQSPFESEIVLVTQSCQTLCDPMDCSPTGSSIHGIFKGGILEWVAIPFSKGSSRPRN